jgi:hypothetical protein
MSSEELSKHSPPELARVYPRSVENSVRHILEDDGFANPDAFIARFDLADIILVLPAVCRMVESNPGIRNPAGLLWRMLEARERKQKQKEEV